MTAIIPSAKFEMGTEGADPSCRVADLICPIGKGQRALIVAPPRTGKTQLIQRLANQIARLGGDVHVIIGLVDERPEEVTDFKRNVAAAEVLASSLDNDLREHVDLVEMVFSRARRLLERGKDVVVFLDSLTRMARAFNNLLRGGRTGTGGLDTKAMEKPRDYFGSARCIEGGGSLTIIATCLIDTGSRLDSIIFEEFKGTGNAEIVLSREMADLRCFPAIDVAKSGTRNEDRFRSDAEMKQVVLLRRALVDKNAVRSMEILLRELAKTKTNQEFLAGLGRQVASD
jgi:transcription termination factor Rho